VRNESGKHWLTAGLLVMATCLAVLSLYGTWRVAADGAVVAYSPRNLLRLHIIPDSDEPADQELKLRVRDAILKRMAPEFSTMKTSGEALEFVAGHQDMVLDTVRAEIAESASRSMECHLELGVFEFPDRAYGRAFVPAGKYRAMRVVLGRGLGQNWWCVLFPPLCFKDLTTGTGDAGAKQSTPVPVMADVNGQRASKPPALVDEESLSEVNVEYRFRVVDWLQTKRNQVLRALARPRPAMHGQ